MPKRIKKNKNGFVALMSVIVLSAVFILIFAAMVFLTTEDLDRGIDEERNIKALFLSEDCIEIAMDKLKEDIDYSGNEQIILDIGICQIEQIEIFGENQRIIKSYGDVSDYIKKSEILVNIINWPELEIIEWISY